MKSADTKHEVIDIGLVSLFSTMNNFKHSPGVSIVDVEQLNLGRVAEL